MTKRIDRRVSFALKLHPELDRDLIEWISSITSGERQGVVKAALRAGAGRVRRDKVDDVLTELRALAKKVATMRVVAAGGDAGGDDTPRISDEEAQARKERMKRQGW